MAHNVTVHPHNDLLNLAHYHRQVVARKVAHEDNEALGLDCMSAIIALAFSVEAIVNVVGELRVPDWVERAPYRDKLGQLRDAIGLRYDPSTEPFATLEVLKSLRDQMAHGKPIHKSADQSTREEMMQDMLSPWDMYAIPDFVERAAAAVDSFQRILLDQSGLHPTDLLTEGSGIFAAGSND